MSGSLDRQKDEDGQDRIRNQQAADAVTRHKADQSRWAKEAGY